MFSRICPRRRPRRQSRRPSQLLGILHLISGKLKNYLNVVNNFTVVNFASSHDIFISSYLCLSDLMDKEICFLVGQVFQSPELNCKLFTFCKFVCSLEYVFMLHVKTFVVRETVREHLPCFGKCAKVHGAYMRCGYHICEHVSANQSTKGSSFKGGKEQFPLLLRSSLRW